MILKGSELWLVLCIFSPFFLPFGTRRATTSLAPLPRPNSAFGRVWSGRKSSLATELFSCSFNLKNFLHNSTMNPVETGLAFASLHKLSMSSQNFSTRCGLCIVVISTETRSLLLSTELIYSTCCFGLKASFVTSMMMTQVISDWPALMLRIRLVKNF